MNIAQTFAPAVVVALANIYAGVVTPVVEHAPANLATHAPIAEQFSGDKEATISQGSGAVAKRVWLNAPHDKLFYVTALVNGKPVRFVVDTGASVVVLTAADAKQANVTQLGSSSLNIQTASGTSSMQAANLDSVELAGQTIENVDAAIVDSNLKTSLLGQSLLSKMKSVRFAGDRLEFN